MYAFERKIYDTNTNISLKDLTVPVFVLCVCMYVCMYVFMYVIGWVDGVMCLTGCLMWRSILVCTMCTETYVWIFVWCTDTYHACIQSTVCMYNIYIYIYTYIHTYDQTRLFAWRWRSCICLQRQIWFGQTLWKPCTTQYVSGITHALILHSCSRACSR